MYKILDDNTETSRVLLLEVEESYDDNPKPDYMKLIGYFSYRKPKNNYTYIHFEASNYYPEYENYWKEYSEQFKELFDKGIERCIQDGASVIFHQLNLRATSSSDRSIYSEERLKIKNEMLKKHGFVLDKKGMYIKTI